MSRKLFLFFVFFLLPFSNLQAKPTVAVMDFSGNGVTESETRALTDRLRTDLVETGKWTVVEREMMNVLLGEQSFQMTGCTDQQCIVAAGQILGAAQMVAGSISKVSRVYSVSARLVDVETGEIIKTAVYDHEGDLGEMLKTGMRVVAGKLAGGYIPEHSSQQESSIPESSGDMIYVEGGIFMMGSNNGDGDEKPVHQVTVSSFYISKCEVTQKEYREVMGKNPSKFKGDDLPVEQISWFDAVEFCNKKSRSDGLTPCYRISGEDVACDFSANGYRLPTEAEWEYAARGGNQSRGYKYSGSDKLDEVGWYWDNSGEKTHFVGTKKPNELGIYDMSGNVWEWCWDWYGAYTSSLAADPRGAHSGEYRVLRGGSWSNSIAYFTRCVFRYSYIPLYRSSIIGFRCVR